MADNFLENHREEYEKRKIRFLNKKSSHLPKSYTEKKRVGNG